MSANDLRTLSESPRMKEVDSTNRLAPCTPSSAPSSKRDIAYMKNRRAVKSERFDRYPAKTTSPRAVEGTIVFLSVNFCLCLTGECDCIFRLFFTFFFFDFLSFFALLGQYFVNKKRSGGSMIHRKRRVCFKICAFLFLFSYNSHYLII